jgi:hypothetical protein
MMSRSRWRIETPDLPYCAANTGIEPRTKLGTTLGHSRPGRFNNALWGLGKLPESYCNSIEDFRRVGNGNTLKLLSCPTPPLGTRTYSYSFA